MPRLIAVAGFALSVSAFLGCGGEDLVLPGDGTPAELSISGDNQSGAPGSALPDSLEVRVLDNAGLPVPGQLVTFALETDAPGAEVSPETATSRSDGIARALWVLGRTSGVQRAVARVARDGADPLEFRFSANVGTGAPVRIAIGEGNEQTAPAGTTLPATVVALVTDEFGNPVSGVEVLWEPEDGSVEPSRSVSGADGRAATIWTLGSAAGSQTLTATSEDLDGSPLTFTAVARAGSPNTLVKVSGDDQSGQTGSELGSPLVVRLLDGAGNGVPNRAVSWVVATGGGSASPATSTTDENGRASTEWTLGSARAEHAERRGLGGRGSGVHSDRRRWRGRWWGRWLDPEPAGIPGSAIGHRGGRDHVSLGRGGGPGPVRKPGD